MNQRGRNSVSYTRPHPHPHSSALDLIPLPRYTNNHSSPAHPIMSAIVIHSPPPTERSRLLPSTPTQKTLDRSAPLKDSISQTRFIIVCTGIWSANFVFAFQSSAIPTLAPSISSGFNHAELSSYLGSVFSLASAAGVSLTWETGEELMYGSDSHPDIWSVDGQPREEIRDGHGVFLLWRRNGAVRLQSEHLLVDRGTSFRGGTSLPLQLKLHS